MKATNNENIIIGSSISSSSNSSSSNSSNNIKSSFYRVLKSQQSSSAGTKTTTRDPTTATKSKKTTTTTTSCKVDRNNNTSCKRANNTSNNKIGNVIIKRLSGNFEVEKQEDEDYDEDDEEEEYDDDVEFHDFTISTTNNSKKNTTTAAADVATTTTTTTTKRNNSLSSHKTNYNSKNNNNNNNSKKSHNISALNSEVKRRFDYEKFTSLPVRILEQEVSVSASANNESTSITNTNNNQVVDTRKDCVKLEDMNSYKFKLYSLEPFDREIFRIQDIRDNIQKRTFTKWMNQHLKHKGLCVNDLYEDLKDGTKLIALLEQLTNRTLIKQKGHMKLHSLENIQTCLDFLKQHRIKLINIHKEEIVNGNPKLTLGLIWIIILYFQIMNFANYIPSDYHIYDFKISPEELLNNKDEMNAKQSLLQWCQENLRGYESVRCKDFSTSWRDGRVLCAILNRHRPDKISFTESFQRSNVDNLRLCFDIAEFEFGVPKIIEPEDMDVDHPDDRSIMTYVSMLFNAMPNIPPHPSEVKLESYKRALLEEYAIICRSLMRWLRDSISTMDNRNVPNNIIEIKSLLNDVKSFRLEEYATRLKEKKKLLNLYDEIMNLPDSENFNVENEIKSIEKVWHKFDNYIQLRENLLEKTYKKYENLQLLIQKIDKLYENCEKQLNQIEEDFNEIAKQLPTMNQVQTNSCNDRFEDQIKQCDHDLRRMFIECQHLKDEEHNEAEYYHKKINQLQNRSLELKSHILNEINSSKTKRLNGHHHSTNSLNGGDPAKSSLNNIYNWIENKKKAIQNQTYPSELNAIKEEIVQTEIDLSDIEKFREKYSKELLKENDQNESAKYSVNELEIAYNLLYNMANCKLKCLKQLEELIKLVNDQLYRLDQIEEIELTRDWSSPHKLSYSSLQAHKNTLDEDLKLISINHIDPINSYGRLLITDNHPATNHIKTYLETVNQHLEWVKQLSYLLGVHLRNFGELENFNNEHGKLSEKIESIKSNLSTILSDESKNSVESIEKMGNLRRELDLVRAECEDLLNKSHRLVPFTMRRLKLKSPYNRCKCLIPYKKATLNIHKDEECIIDDNTQRIKWKVRTHDGQTGLVPSVCFQLPPLDEDSVDLAQQLKTKCENLSKQAHSCQTQLRKDRLFDMMNVIKFCELDEFEERKKTSIDSRVEEDQADIESLLKRIRVEMEELQRDAPSSSQDNHYQTSDMRMLIDTYEKCNRRVNELNEKSLMRDEYTKMERDLEANLDGLEMRLSYLRNERLAQLKARPANSSLSFSSNLDKLIFLYQEFDRNDLKSFENEIENTYKRIEVVENASYRHHHHRHTSTSTPNGTSSTMNTLRQRLDNLQMEANALRNETNTNVQNINMVKVLIGLLENADKWLTKTEEKLANQELLTTIFQFPTTINRILYELEEVESSLKQRQDDINKIRAVSDKIEVIRMPLSAEIANIDELLEASEESKQRYKALFAQIADRVMLAREVQEAYDTYETQHKRETKWVKLLRKQCDDYELKQHLVRQQKFDLRRKYNQPQSHSQQQYEAVIEDDLNDLKSNLDTNLKFNQLLIDYRRGTTQSSLTIVEPLKSNDDEVLNQLRHELNSLNREYSNFLNDYNQKLKQLASSISEKSSSTPNNKQFLSTVQILINQQEKQHENVEPLISRYTQDVFDRYDLSNNNINSKYSSSSNYTNLINTSTTLQQQERHQQSQQTPVTTEYHYYYTDNDSTTIDENDPPTAAFFSTTTTSTSSPSSCTTNSSQPPVKATAAATSTATTITNMHPNDLLSIVEYPLSFYDAVNQCQLDLITGCLKPNNTFLADAIRLNLLDPKSAYIVTPASPNPIDLSEAVRKGIITSSNKVYVGPGVHLSLSDALKQGYLKLESGRNLTTSCSVSSETQSMSVKSIRDPSTGELLAPTEAINRKLLDPYKGLFVNSQTGEQMPISEAIHKGFIVVEMISPSKTSTKKDSNFTSSSAAATATDENSNVVSTSLVRETKSYHLLAVFDPTKNDEITIKEAINRGILDRKRGVYVHPLTNESYSISDAINKGLIRARVITPPSTLGSPHQHHLVSSNRFEENRSYTITAAIDPRTHKPIGLSQAMRDGIIDAKNGTYVNIVTGEAISINKAIELKLVLTGAANDDSSSSSSTSPRNKSTRATATTTKSSRPSSVSSSSAHERHKSPRREVTTLNVEAVRDVRTGRMVSVSEAMQLGLLDRNTLNYCNPITQEVLTLSRAHERGYIQGHYSDATTTTSNLTTTTTTRSSVNEESYFIIDIFDPRINKSLTLDQAISSGLFDHSRGVYIHPLTNEQISLGDAVRKGLIQAQSFSPSPPAQPSNGEQQHRYDPRLPVGAFGIDKQIKSMRTKFNRDGTSVLQIDIESTRPSRGVYEVDEIEEFTVNEKLVNDHHDADQVVRKVVDINSVHRVDNPNKPPEPQLINLSHDHSSSSSLHHASVINNLVHEKNILKVEVNKELGADLKIQRFEDVVDDDHYYRRPNGAQSNGVGVVRINVDSNNNTSVIPERKTFDAEHQQRVQTLVIDDANPDKYSRRAVNIEGQNYVHKNEVQINDKQRRDDLFDVTQRSVEELNRKIELIRQERANQVKVKTAEVVDTRVVSNERKNLDLDDQRHTIERNVKVTVDIKGDDRPKAPRPVQTIVDESTTQSHRVVYEDSFKVDSKPPKTSEDDDESFEEWTEVYTITVRGIRYKIIWVYDALKNERVTLSEAIERGIIDLKKSTYHNLKTSYSSTLNEAVDDGLIGIEEDNTALILKVNGITYTIYWLWDPVKRKRVSPKRAIERGILDLEKLVYRNYQSGECISVHEAVYMKLIGASDDLSSIEEELVLKIDGVEYKIAWVKDSRSGEKYKPRDALRHGLLDLTNYFYNKYDTNESLTIPVAIDQNWIGLSEMNRNESQTSTTDSDSESSTTATSTRRGLNRQDSLLSLDDEELTIKTKTAIYVITGLLHPETQKEIKVSEAIRLGILAPDTGAYKDFKTNVVYEVGEAINEGIVFATVTDLLQDEQASTEFLREEIKRFIVKSVVDPRTHEKIGGLQAQAAGILNYAQGVYTNPDTGENIPISEAIARNYIQVQLQEETAHEEFDAEVVTETLMERRVTNYRILGVLDPFSNELISASEAVHRQIIDTETNAYVDASVRDASVPIKEAVRRNLIQAEVSESIERKPLGLTLQNAIRLGLYVPDTGKFKDLYSNRYFDLNQAIEKGHINPNGAALADSSSGSMTLNEAFSYSIISKRTGILDRQRLNMFKGKIVEGKIYKWNFEDAVKCGIVSLKTGRYKHQQTGESLSIRDAINRGLIDGETTIIECPSGELMALRSALDSAVNIDDNGNIVSNGQTVTSLEQAFNSRKIFSAFDENTGEIFLPSLGKIVPFEKAIRRKKMDKSVKIFDPKSNRDLTVNDAIERAIIDKTSGMIIDPKGCGGLLSIKEAVKRGIVSIAGAPVVTGHHNSETIEAPTITSRKLRHHPPQRFDDVTGSLPIVKSRNSRHHHHRDEKLKSSSSSRISSNSQTNGSNLKSKSYSKTPIIYDAEYLQSDLLKDVDPTVKATYKTTNEEHRKKISGNDVTELLKSDYKETLLEPGEKPKVTASANYQKQTNSKLDDSTAATTTTN